MVNKTDIYSPGEIPLHMRRHLSPLRMNVYKHSGIDLVGIARAFGQIYIGTMECRAGRSTMQQLVKTPS